jgi:hypothetical protein
MAAKELAIQKKNEEAKLVSRLRGRHEGAAEELWERRVFAKAILC